MALADLEPVNRESTAGIIARQLRSAIMNGALPPGTQLGESELAAKFAVSRGPLREAMQRLVQEGLLRSERHRGLFVIDLEPADIHDIYVTRNAIEQAAARLIMRGDRRAVANRLGAIHDEMRSGIAKRDPQAVSESDALFHQVFVAASGSRRLNRMARTLLIETRMCISALQRTYRLPDDQVAEHGAIVEAIRNNDEPLLLALIESHMEDAIQRLAPGCSLRGPAPARSEPEEFVLDGYPDTRALLEPELATATSPAEAPARTARGGGPARTAAKAKRRASAVAKTGKSAASKASTAKTAKTAKSATRAVKTTGASRITKPAAS